MKNIEQLHPENLWSHFAAICAVPHPSGSENEIANHVGNFCRGKSISFSQDAAGNILLTKNASSADFASAPKIALQAHLDMVPQADADKKHDFSSDPISPLLDGEWVRADGTTLGADNGVGIAAILAVMESDDIPHGPLSAILTVEEETGLKGASSLNPEFIDADILINLDSEDSSELYVSCAGGCETSFTIATDLEPVTDSGAVFREIRVSGLEGGHSGVDIHLDRGNAIIILASLLAEFADSTAIRIGKISGGSVSNAIPREASAKIALSGAKAEKLAEIADEFQVKTKESHPNDPNLRIELLETRPFEKGIPAGKSAEIAKAVATCPNGVVRMSDELPGTVETSSNIGAVEIDVTSLRVITMQRSLVESEMREIREKISRHMETAGFKTTFGDSFPPWEPARDSRILKVCADAYKRLFGEAPKIVAIHAGLECGVIGRLKPGLDMISFGPDIKYPHSPKEKVSVAGVEKFWRLLTTVLADVAGTHCKGGFETRPDSAQAESSRTTENSG